MKNFYYFSKSRLQFVEIKNHKLKLAIFALGIFIFSSMAIFTGKAAFNSVFGSPKDISELRNENSFLNNKIKEITTQYDKLNSQLESLIKVNSELRLASNLPPLTDEERLAGTGGGSFDNTLDFLKSDNKEELRTAFEKIDEVSKKFAFEKENFNKITKAIEHNKKLFGALPAIKPSRGVLALNGFGIRYHPILRVNKMHEGIDIITDVGTDVFATGDGVVDFVGSKGGFGLAVEINHGFGYRTIYAHLSKSLVKEGMKITRGTIIAKTGNSGLSSGPHLHYEVIHNGMNKNPMEFFFDDFSLSQLANKN